MKEFYNYFTIPGFEHYPHVTYTWIVMIFLIVSAFLSTRVMKMIPEGGQNFFEAFLEGMAKFMEDLMGPEGPRYLPLIATVAIFILVSNLLGLLPGFMSPTSNINTNVACAVVVFFATHYVGIRTHGVKYIKHFTGPMWALAPLMLPIELIGHCARVLSLSMRLFGNIKGHDIVLIILATWALAPIPMMFLGVFVSFVQAFVFMLLSMIYIAGALEEAH